MGAKYFVDRSSRSDEAVASSVAESGQGTSGELARLFESHNQALVRYLAVILGSPDDAGEVAQEAYARLLRLDCSETVSHLRAYLFRTARNIAIDRLRTRTRQNKLLRLVAEHDEEPLSVDDPENVAIAMDMVTDLKSIIRELPPKCQTAFILYKFRNQSYAEIAGAMKLTESMIRKYVQRALIHCHQRLWQEE